MHDVDGSSVSWTSGEVVTIRAQSFRMVSVKIGVRLSAVQHSESTSLEVGARAKANWRWLPRSLHQHLT